MKLFFTLLLLMTGCRPPVPESLPVVETRAEEPETPRPPLILKADYVAEILGDPALKRRENPAEVWVYPADECVLFVYFDANGEVRHMEIGEPSNKAPHRGEACLIMAGKLRP